MTNVLIVEDERLTADAFAGYIATAPDRYRLIQSIRNADDAELVLLRQPVDLIIMDICTSSSNGLEAAKVLKKKYPRVKIIIVISTVMLFSLEEAKAAGIDSFWHKESSDEFFLEVMDRTVAGEHIYLSEMPEVPIGCARSGDLTLRQMQTLYYLIKYRKIADVAEKMQCNVNGVNKHLKDIKAMTGISDTGELLRIVEMKKLILPDYMDEDVFLNRYKGKK